MSGTSEAWQSENQRPKAQQQLQQQEGSAKFYVGDAFCRRSSQTGRDLAVLAAIAYKNTQGHLRILDTKFGSAFLLPAF
ncbi:MAG: hypothetical protein AAGL17_14930 [Cyanobacteria bacterium J06576_12]